MASAPFRNLVRFLDDASNELYGEVADEALDKIVGSTVKVLEGDLYNLQSTEKIAVVKKVVYASSPIILGLADDLAKLLSPLSSTPLFVCVGLNYAAHAKEAKLQIPPNPVVFTKPAGEVHHAFDIFHHLIKTLDALAGPLDDIPVPRQADLMDYEGELCIIIKKDGKNVQESEALEYVFGYTAGNDLSSRHWQRPPRSGGQFCFAKSFDRFAPIGPTILSADAADPSTFRILTRVNGETRQDAPTSDMVFSVSQIIAHVSQGTTLRKGTVIMTGTPAGIAAKMAGEPWLKDGDVVEVKITGIGTIRNRMVFE